MEQITIKSGPCEVLASGSVISFKDNPIVLKLPYENNYFNGTCLAPDQSFLNLPQNVFRPEKLNNMSIILFY
jgi:hypothetical protein